MRVMLDRLSPIDHPRLAGRPRTVDALAARGSGVRVLPSQVLDMPGRYDLAWLDLNEKHFVHGLSGWVLKSAEAFNNSRPSGSGHIVGTGLLNGSPRAFVLVPNSIP